MTTPASSNLKVLRQLASDAHSDAFLAEVKGFDAPMVVRVVKPELAANEPRMNTFIAGARMLAEVSSPALLQVRSAGRMKDGRVYVLTDFAEGEVLASHGPLTLEQMVDVGIPLSEALGALHQAGMVLGAVTAQEILLTASGPKLDASLAPLGRVPGATSQSDVRALADLLGSVSLGPAAENALDSSVRRGMSEAGSALQLLGALDAVRQRWAGDTRVSSKKAPAAEATTAEVESVSVHEPDLTGQTLGSYELVGVLGEGAMGKVYLGKHKKIGREAAIKVLKAEHAVHEDLVQRFIKEATAVNAIKNEHIVEVYDFGHDLSADGRKQVFCVMEVLRGRALCDEMDLGTMPVQRAARICQQLTRALGAAHALGVVHRDVKPENIFLHQRDGDPDYVKVLDFGVAKLLKPLADLPTSGTQAGIVIGTPEYMAPEQALGLPTDYRIDLYAVGLVLYELLSGRQPFEGGSFGKLVVEITTKPPPLLPAHTSTGETIPPGLVSVIDKCLAKKPEDRWSTAEELAVALDPFVYSGRTVMVSPPAPAAAAAPSDAEALAAMRPSRMPLALGGLVLALLVAGGAFFALKPVTVEPVAVAAPPPPPVVRPVEPPVAAAPEKATLDIASEPPGATVTRLDTLEVLGTTPFKVEAAQQDAKVALRLELAGHEPLETEVALAGAVTLKLSLTAIARPPEPVKPKPVVDPKGKHGKKVTRDGQLDPFSN